MGRRPRVERPKAAREHGVGRGCPLPTGGRVWGGGYAPFPENFSNFYCKMRNFGAF